MSHDGVRRRRGDYGLASELVPRQHDEAPRARTDVRVDGGRHFDLRDAAVPIAFAQHEVRARTVVVAEARVDRADSLVDLAEDQAVFREGGNWGEPRSRGKQLV